ncbi:MAG: DsbA family protein [Polyangiales bacterium]
MLVLQSGAGCQKSAPPDSCARWTAEVCKQAATDESVCDSAKDAAGLFTPAVCAAALAGRDVLRNALAARKQKCAELASKVCHDVGERNRSCHMVREQSRRLPPERCIQMLGKYADVLSELEQQWARYRLPSAQAAKLTAGDPPAFGPKQAPLQLVELIDFENRDCVLAAKIVRTLRDKYGDALRFVVRQFPLPYNPHAYLAAEAALAAHAQGKFWELHDALLAHQQQLDRAALDRYAKGAGLDIGRFDAALDRKTYAAAVDADLALGHELSVEGMPTMFLNGERMLLAVDQARIVEAIEERLAMQPNR